MSSCCQIAMVNLDFLDANYNVLIKNKLYGEFEVVQRMNENTFLIKMAEKEFFIDSNGDFK